MDSLELEALWKNLAESPGKGSQTRPLEKLMRRAQKGFPSWKVLYTRSSAKPQLLPTAPDRARTFRLTQSYELGSLFGHGNFNRLVHEDLLADVSSILIEGSSSSKNGHLGIELLEELCQVYGDSDTAQHPALQGLYPALLRFECPVSTIKQVKGFKQAPDNIWSLFDFENFLNFAEDMTSLQGRPTIVRMSSFHQRGAHASTELALLLATAAEIERLQIPLPKIEWRLAVNSALLGSVAKLRAARMLLALARSQGLQIPSQSTLSAETSLVELSHIDTWSNIIRNSISAAAAFIGGSEGLLVHPHDKRVAVPNPFGHRIARNIVHLAAHESHLDKFDDPFGGSFALENQTQALAETAWTLFVQIEDSGGLAADLKKENGLIAEQLKKDRSELIRGERRRCPGLIGVSEFADLTGLASLKNHENPEAILTAGPAMTMPLADSWKDPLVLSAIFGSLRERLRVLAQTQQDKSSTDQIFPYKLKIYGDTAMLSPRISWVENAMAAGGFFRDDFTENSPIEVIVGSDESYVTNLCEWLKASHSGAIPIVAGRLSDDLFEKAKACGLHSSVFASCDLAFEIEKIIQSLEDLR